MLPARPMPLAPRTHHRPRSARTLPSRIETTSIRRPTPRSPASTCRTASTARNASRGFPPHHLFPRRPDVMARYRGPNRRAEGRIPRSCCRTQSGGARRSLRRRRPPFRRLDDPFPKPTYPLRSRRGDLAAVNRPIRHGLGPQGRSRHLCRARQGRSLRLGHAVAQRVDALGRRGLLPRIRSRRVQHRRRSRISTWAPWRTRASTSSTTSTSWPCPRPRPMPTT